MPRPDEDWMRKGWYTPRELVGQPEQHDDLGGATDRAARYLMDAEDVDNAEYWHEVYMILLEMKNGAGPKGDGADVCGHMGSGGGSDSGAAGVDGAG